MLQQMAMTVLLITCILKMFLTASCINAKLINVLDDTLIYMLIYQRGDLKS